MPRFSAPDQSTKGKGRGRGRSFPSTWHTPSQFQTSDNNAITTVSGNKTEQQQQEQKYVNPYKKSNKASIVNAGSIINDLILEDDNLDFDDYSNHSKESTPTVHVTDKSIKKRNTKSKPKDNSKPSNNKSSSIKVNAEKSNDISSTATTTVSTAYDIIPKFLENESIKRALCIDTRIQKNFECDVAGRSFQSNLYLFLQEIERRGILPTYLSTMKYKKHARNGRDLTAIEVLVNRLKMEVISEESIRMNDMDQKTWREINISPLYVKDNLNKNLSARESWRLFAEFVDKVVAETLKTAQKQVPQDIPTINKSPINIILLTTDIALFSDSNSDSHKQGLDMFWSRLRKHFKNNHIRSVTILIVSTADGMISWKPSSEEGMNESQSSFHQFQITQCLHKLHGHLTHLQQREYYNYSQKDSNNGRQIILDMNSIECNAIAMNELSRFWLRESMQNNDQFYGSLKFDLPETLDGCMCSITLELEYATFPYSLASSEGVGLMLDAYLLRSAASTKVKQVVPISLIDASLLYGVPMMAKAGRSNEYNANNNEEDEIIQYREMCTLVTQLLKWLDDNDCALLLHCSFLPSSCSDLKDYSHVKVKNRFKSYSTHEQFFLLMAQHDEKNASNVNKDANMSKRIDNSHGVLFRYAMEEQLLYDMEDKDKYSSFENNQSNGTGEIDNTEDDEDIIEAQRQYYDYIERSLDFLEKGGINPILMSMQTRFSINSANDTNDNDQNENHEILDKDVNAVESQENTESLAAVNKDGYQDNSVHDMNYFESVDDEHINHVFDYL